MTLSFVRNFKPIIRPILMTPKQAAAKLGMSLTTFEEEVAAGKLAFVSISKAGAASQHRRYAQMHLDDYVKSNTAKETPKCQSSKSPTPHIIITNFKSTGKSFEAQLDEKIAKKQSKSSGK